MPRVTKPKADHQTQTLSLDVAVTDGGGGVKEVNIYHNDKLVMTTVKRRPGRRRILYQKL